MWETTGIDRGKNVDSHRGFAVPVSDPARVRLLRRSILKGRNIYHSSTVIRQSVDFGPLSDKLTREAGYDFCQRFLRRFIDPLRTLPNARINERFVTELHAAQGVAFEDALLEAILSVESLTKYYRNDFLPIGAALVVNREKSPNTFLVWESRFLVTSRATASVGLRGLLELLPESLHPSPDADSEDFETAFATLKGRASQMRLSATTSLIALAAKQRGIPSNHFGGPHLYLGQGAAQRLVYSSVPSDAPYAALQLSRDKRKTIRRLAELHLLVPEQIKVTSLDAAVAAAEKLGYPVVVKPLKGKVGGGVTVGVIGPKEIPAAFEFAQSAGVQMSGSGLVVESFVAGLTFRLLVMGGKFVAALKILPPTVVGDGEKSVAALIEALNNDPLRDSLRLYPVKVDDEVTGFLRRQGLAMDSVLEKGREVVVRSASNVGIGAVHSDVTDIVHPKNQEMAVCAAKGVGLTVAGIDFVTPDISRSYKEVGGKIIEVNARPAFCQHYFPCHGKSRNPSEAMLDMAFPAGVSGLIPSALVFGERRTAAVAQKLDALLRAAGKTTGLITHKGAHIAGEPLELLEQSKGREAVQNLLRDPRVEALTLAVSPRRAVGNGLTIDSVQTVAIMNCVSDSDAQVYCEALRIVIEAARGVIVADARNTFALEAMSELDATKLILVSSHPRDAVIDLHLAKAGTAVVMEYERGQDRLVIWRKDTQPTMIPLAGARAGIRPNPHRTEATMYAVALGLGMGLSDTQLVELLPLPVKSKLTQIRRGSKSAI